MNTVTVLLERLVIDCSIRVSRSYIHFFKGGGGGGEGHVPPLDPPLQTYTVHIKAVGGWEKPSLAVHVISSQL